MTTTKTPSREESRARHPAGRMGPPAGKRSTVFVVLLATVSVLALLGTVMVLSASSVSDLRMHGTAWYSFKRQLVYLGVGAAALVVALRTPYRMWRRLAQPVLLISVGLLVLVLVSPFGVTRNGSTRWLAFGGIQIQPAEITKLAVVLFCADLLSRPTRDIRDTRATLRPVMLVFGVLALLLMAQPDLGTLIVTGLIVFVILYVAGTPLVPLGLLGSVGVAGTLALSMQESYRRARLTAFLDPWGDPLNTGYQSIQSLVGIANGGVTGVGLGASRAKWGFLPYAHTDFIFAVIAEELGLVGAALVIGLFVVLAAAGTRVAIGSPDRLGLLLAAGITVWFVGQAVVNIGAAVSALPVTGVPLPFVSFGGTALVINLFATGILLNVARHRAVTEADDSARGLRGRGTQRQPWALIAGGGTAGHTLPAIAIGQALVERGHPPETIRFVGSKRGREAELVPEAGFGITLLPGRGIQRRVSLANVGAVLGIMAAFAHALVLVGRRRPKVAVAMGGYASVAVAMAATLWRVPLVVAEQNAVPGAANRLAARFARVSAVSFPDTGLPREVVTGNPVRAEVQAVRGHDQATARRSLGLGEGRSLVLVFGGSLGALHINTTTVEAVEVWRDRSDLTVRHVVGARDWDELRRPDLEGAAIEYSPVAYEEDMPRALASADLIVSRSGATTVAELTTIGRASVLVPLPGAPGDHQTANARALADAGAAVLLPDAELDAPRLVAEVDPLIADPARREAMAASAASLGRPDAAARVAELVESHARG